MSAQQEQVGRVVCVFCGSKPGKSEAHLAAARELAHIFHKENITLVYGGGTAGIMGEIARTLVSLSGPEAVHGIIPSALVKVEDGHRTTLTAESTNAIAAASAGGKAPERIIKAESTTTDSSKFKHMENLEYGMTTIVPDMHTRKRLMAEKVIKGGPGSGFVTLPGGFGTLEEAMEMITWNQLAIHSRGIVLLNIEGYWDGVLSWVKKSVEQEFVSPLNKDIVVECTEANQVVGALKGYSVSEGRYVLDWQQPKDGADA